MNAEDRQMKDAFEFMVKDIVEYITQSLEDEVKRIIVAQDESLTDEEFHELEERMWSDKRMFDAWHAKTMDMLKYDALEPDKDIASLCASMLPEIRRR